MKQKKISLLSIAFIFAFLLSISFYFDLWKKNRLIIDAPSYYTYLPAAFIYHDLHLKFVDRNPSFFKEKLWYYKIGNGNRLIKHPMGLSVALSPFFLLGHATAKLTGSSADGYSLIYQNFMSAGVLIYLFLGIFYLRKVLLRFFSEKATALTLVSLVLGTNLLWYSTFEGLMTHAVSFSLLSISLYLFFEWLHSANKRTLYLFALAFGLSVLIRPLSVTVILYFLIVAIMSKGGLQLFYASIRPQLKAVISASMISVVIISLQLFYWKYITGNWIYDAYQDEVFLFSRPEIMSFLFSFRKGIFIYTPVLIFVVLGLFRLYKTQRPLFLATVIIMSLTIFMLSSWWAWSYGICWGIRPMIDYYALLAIPLASGFSMLFSGRKIISVISMALVTVFIFLNLFQTWQYKNGLIHYDDMSREAYFKDFFRTEITNEWRDLLKPYDWDRRMKGLSQVEYSPSYFRENFKTNKIFLRGYNLQFVTMNEKAKNAIAAYQKNASAYSLFRIVPVKEDIVSLMAANGDFLSVNPEYDNVLMASAFPGTAEKFQIIFMSENDNKIALKTMQGKYVTVGDEFPYLLYPKATSPGQKETLRIFVKQHID